MVENKSHHTDVFISMFMRLKVVKYIKYLIMVWLYNDVALCT